MKERYRVQPSCKLGTVLLGAALAMLLAACARNSDPPPTQTTAAALTPRHGGEAVVLVGSDFSGTWPTGLDPATNTTGGSNIDLMSAIFAGLFQLTADDDGSHARVIPVLAEGHEFKDEGRTFVIRLRPGVKFSDGTPFDSAAVKAHIDRVLDSGCSCSPTTWPWVTAPEDRVSAPDEHTVELHFARPNGAMLTSITVSAINWVASPTALKAIGPDEFKIRPVGAGPFKVVSNELSSRLVLERNPNYWQAGHPYLDRLVFQSIGSEQAGYDAVVSGNARAFLGVSSPPLVEQAEKDGQITVTRQPGTSPYVVQVNTSVAPFDGLKAREALYYATDAAAIRKGLFKDRYPLTQSFTTPMGLFHHDTVPNYRTYDLAKARALVKELGGLQVTLGTLKSILPEQITTALQTQWQAAGIQVRIETYQLSELINKFRSRQWQAMLQTAGSFDPDSGSGLRFRFGSGATFSGVQDGELDELIRSAAGTVEASARDALYQKTAQYISDKAYGLFLIANSNSQMSRGLYGPGLTTKIPPVLVNTATLWQDVWMSAE